VRMKPGAPLCTRAIFDGLLIGAFVVALAYPSVDPILRPHASRTALVEFRNPAPFPAHPRSIDEWTAYPQAFDAFFGDHFGLRDKLVRWHNLADWFVFGVSPTPKLVLGEGAWVFYDDDKSLEVYRGAYPLAARELEGWRRMLTARRDWLAQRGIRYLFVFVPNKDQVYPEHLPPPYAQRGTTRLDQLVECMRAHGDVDVLDLRPALVAEKANDAPEDFVYHRLGTHWTDRGAYAGYAALVEHLKHDYPALTPLARSSFRVEQTGEGDSWAAHLYMDDLLRQSNFKWTLESPHATFDAAAVDGAETFQSDRADSTLPRALVLHDSFGPPLRPWLAENFSHLTWSWGWSFDARFTLIETEKPDIVIEMFVDRVLVQDYPQVSAALDADAEERAFDASTRVVAKFDGANLSSALTPYGRTQFVPTPEPTEGGLALRIVRGMDGVLIPAVQFPTDADLIVAIDLVSYMDTGLDLFFRTKTETTFERRRVCNAPLKNGANRVLFRLYGADLAGPMFLHFRNPQVYRLRSIELRATSD
jgi:hypothetical protein